MATTELFKIVIATWGYAPIGKQIYGVFEHKAEAMRIKDIALGIVIDNETGLGWPRGWRIVSAEPDEHIEAHTNENGEYVEGRGAIIASCEAVEGSD